MPKVANLSAWIIAGTEPFEGGKEKHQMKKDYRKISHATLLPFGEIDPNDPIVNAVIQAA